MAQNLRIVSFDLCPYVERSRIVLLEKGLPHEVTSIDLHPAPALMPGDPLDRADARAWIVFCNDTLMLLSLKAQMALSAAKTGTVDLEPLRAALGKVETELARRGGPFFLGRNFTLAERAAASN
jgi:glutathione S-transferase